MPDTNILKIEKHKLAFMFVSKAGSTSIKKVLRDKFLNTESKKNHGPTALHPLGIYCKKDAIPDDYLVFGTCRHPEDRLVSCWKDKVCRDELYQGFCLRLYPMYVGMPFDEFVEVVASIKDNFLCDQHIRSQYLDLDLKKVQHLIKIENFKNDWETARKLIREHCNENYPVIECKYNKTNLINPEIDMNTRRLIEERYAKDYEILGYKKRL